MVLARKFKRKAIISRILLERKNRYLREKFPQSTHFSHLY